MQYNRHGILTVFRGRGYASLSPPPDGVQPPMKEDGKQSKPPSGGVGVRTEKEGFLCALKSVELCLLIFIFLSFGVLLFIFAAKNGISTIVDQPKQELYGTKRRY